jgi:hypothetical protein
MFGECVVLCGWLLCSGAAFSPANAQQAGGIAQVAPWKSRPSQKPAPPVPSEPEREPSDSDDWRELGTRDPLLEKRAQKNIEVAEFYARRKNFRASINRLTEIYEVYPQFTHFDRILFLLGKYHLGQSRLLEDELRQQRKQGQQEERKADEARTHAAEARRYFSELIERFPESKLVKDARKELERLSALASPLPPF